MRQRIPIFRLLTFLLFAFLASFYVVRWPRQTFELFARYFHLNLASLSKCQGFSAENDGTKCLQFINFERTTSGLCNFIYRRSIRKMKNRTSAQAQTIFDLEFIRWETKILNKTRNVGQNEAVGKVDINYPIGKIVRFSFGSIDTRFEISLLLDRIFGAQQFNIFDLPTRCFLDLYPTFAEGNVRLSSLAISMLMQFAFDVRANTLMAVARHDVDMQCDLLNFIVVQQQRFDTKHCRRRSTNDNAQVEQAINATSTSMKFHFAKVDRFDNALHAHEIIHQIN